jgi:hypothetical protein
MPVFISLWTLLTSMGSSALLMPYLPASFQKQPHPYNLLLERGLETLPARIEADGKPHVLIPGLLLKSNL